MSAGWVVFTGAMLGSIGIVLIVTGIMNRIAELF